MWYLQKEKEMRMRHGDLTIEGIQFPLVTKRTTLHSEVFHFYPGCSIDECYAQIYTYTAWKCTGQTHFTRSEFDSFLANMETLKRCLGSAGL